MREKKKKESCVVCFTKKLCFWKGKRFLRRKVSNPIFSDCWVCGHQAWGFRNFWIDVKQKAKGEREEWKNKTNGKNRTDGKEKRKRNGEKSVANEKEKLSFTIEFRTARKVVFVELADRIWVEREQESLSLRKNRSEDRTTFGKRERTTILRKEKKRIRWSPRHTIELRTTREKKDCFLPILFFRV